MKLRAKKLGIGILCRLLVAAVLLMLLSDILPMLLPRVLGRIVWAVCYAAGAIWVGTSLLAWMRSRKSSAGRRE